jgi:DNA repair protein RecN (Recombination protein N)
LEKLSGLAENVERARSVEESAAKRMLEAAKTLSEKRREGSLMLAGHVAKELSDLGFRQPGFDILLEELPEAGPDGAETADFLFSPNPGEPRHPLRSIASSGEISRVMLAIKTALAGQDRIPLLVFDEIDANVGGEIATMVASKMTTLGLAHQVICITHLPQVAAAGASQFLVSKEVRDGRTSTSLVALEGEERVAEIARMLGGASESSVAHARALLTPSPVNPETKSRPKAPKSGRHS